MKKQTWGIKRSTSVPAFLKMAPKSKQCPWCSKVCSSWDVLKEHVQLCLDLQQKQEELDRLRSELSKAQTKEDDISHEAAVVAPDTQVIAASPAHEGEDSSSPEVAAEAESASTDEYDQTLPREVLLEEQKDEAFIACPFCHVIFFKKEAFLQHFENEHDQAGEAEAETDTESSQEAPPAEAPDQEAAEGEQSRAEGPSPPLQCSHCPVSTRSVRLFKLHNQTEHGDERPFKCGHCEKGFRLEGDLRAHRDRVHLKIRRFVCAVCSGGFSSRWEVSQHAKKRHGAKGAHGCQRCPLHFLTLRAKREHEAKEHQERPQQQDDNNNTNKVQAPRRPQWKQNRFACTYCDRAFPTNPRLEEHVAAKHLYVTPYKCSECNKHYGYKASFKRHWDSVHRRL